jgi:hypothetical protein
MHPLPPTPSEDDIDRGGNAHHGGAGAGSGGDGTYYQAEADAAAVADYDHGIVNTLITLTESADEVMEDFLPDEISRLLPALAALRAGNTTMTGMYGTNMSFVASRGSNGTGGAFAGGTGDAEYDAQLARDGTDGIGNHHTSDRFAGGFEATAPLIRCIDNLVSLNFLQRVERRVASLGPTLSSNNIVDIIHGFAGFGVRPYVTRGVCEDVGRRSSRGRERERARVQALLEREVF